MTTVEADDPVGTSVTFNREIVRIIQRKCESCHVRGGLAMSLSEFREVRAWGRAIREELVTHRMPPAIVARGYGRYQSDPGLNAREMATFLAWLDGGMPRGDEADRPARPAFAEATAGKAVNGEAAHHQHGTEGAARLALPPQKVPAGENLVVRRVTIDAGAAGGRSIARVQLQPGNRRVLRGARIFVEPPEGRPHWVGGWLPWQHAIVPPSSHAFQVRPGSTVTAELHYRGAETEQVDESAIDVTFASDAPKGGLEDVVLEARDEAAGLRRGRTTLRQAMSVWAVYPALDASLKSLELRAERPDKSVDVLLWIPEARPEWPLSLVLQEPVALPAGTTLSLVAEVDRGPQPFDTLRVAPSTVEGQGSAPHVWPSADAPRVTVAVATLPPR